MKNDSVKPNKLHNSEKHEQAPRLIPLWDMTALIRVVEECHDDGWLRWTDDPANVGIEEE
jgi:hypothetical protein